MAITPVLALMLSCHCMQICFYLCLVMINAESKARIIRANHLCESNGITQGQIALGIGANQSQVSRVLSGSGKRFSRLSEAVCSYVESCAHGVTAEAVQSNQELVAALRAVWDGSESHARQLAAVIRSLAAFGGKSPTPDRE